MKGEHAKRTILVLVVSYTVLSSHMLFYYSGIGDYDKGTPSCSWHDLKNYMCPDMKPNQKVFTRLFVGEDGTAFT